MPEYTQGTGRAAQFVLPDGEYLFRVDDAEERLSQNENQLIKLKLAVLDPANKKRITVWTNLVFMPGCLWMIDGFRSATGEKIVKGEKCSLSAEDCIGRRGYLVLGTQEWNGAKHNVVKKYVRRRVKDDPNAQEPVVAARSSSGPEPDDIPDIPF